MAYEPTDEGGESDLRRRAAWLLAMLVVVAILIVVVMTTLLNTDKGSGGDTGTGPDAITSTGPAVPTSSGSKPAPTTSGTSSATDKSGTTPSTGPGSSTTAASGAKTCPTSAPCALDGDVGNAVAAINAFRADKGKPAIPGAVSDAAKKCALNRGSGCSGGWAETEIPAPVDGKLAVKKISQFAMFTESAIKSIEVGWAYNPGSKTYYFATIRKD